MFVWWFIGSIGFLFVGINHCQDTPPILVDIEPKQENDVQVALSIDDTPPKIVPNDTNNVAANEGTGSQTESTTTPTPEPFSCHECINCNTKSDFKNQVCESGINMCYKLNKRIDNTTRIIRGCSTSKAQCTTPEDSQSNTVESITCCTSHKCNQATQSKPLRFLSTLSLFITILLIPINI